LPYERIEFFLSATGGIKENDSSLLVYLPYKNYFFEHNDRRGMKILVLKHIFMIDAKIKFKDYPKFLAELDAYRKIIKNGFSEELYYYFFIHLMKKDKHVKTLNDYIDINIPWLSFYKLDDYISDFFKEFAKKFKIAFRCKTKSKIIRFMKNYETNTEKINEWWKNANNKI